jgi:hypothetical protein
VLQATFLLVYGEWRSRRFDIAKRKHSPAQSALHPTLLTEHPQNTTEKPCIRIGSLRIIVITRVFITVISLFIIVVAVVGPVIFVCARLVIIVIAHIIVASNRVRQERLGSGLLSRLGIYGLHLVEPGMA